MQYTIFLRYAFGNLHAILEKVAAFTSKGMLWLSDCNNEANEDGGRWCCIAWHEVSAGYYCCCSSIRSNWQQVEVSWDGSSISKLLLRSCAHSSRLHTSSYSEHSHITAALCILTVSCFPVTTKLVWMQGLSEPLGALIALIAVKPFISEEPLHYILAFVGGIMLAVCCLELWPEARRCKQDRRLTQGCVVGVIVMLATLAVGIWFYLFSVALKLLDTCVPIPCFTVGMANDFIDPGISLISCSTAVMEDAYRRDHQDDWYCWDIHWKSHWASVQTCLR